jgi:glycosyltransferase involved in cell wall biosynthesis
VTLSQEPLVSVVTPVYDCEVYIEDCIKSVLAQTYSNWEYLIVNNRSTDGTLAIAQKYATADRRIRISTNDAFLDIIANHNHAFRSISPLSKYCKDVSADDWLYPECISRMVSLAEAHPSVGIVGAYQLSGGGDKWYVRTYGLPYHKSVISGREICRSHLLTDLSVFGNPTTNLYRSDLVRATEEFFPNSTAEADVSACFKHLRSADFGFVHQVLSYERLHEVQITRVSRDLNAYLPSKLGDLLEYGHFYLTEDEFQCCVRDRLTEYYKFLAISAVNIRERKFWDYHRRRLKELGFPLSARRLSMAVCAKLFDLVCNPKRTFEALVSRI